MSRALKTMFAAACAVVIGGCSNAADITVPGLTSESASTAGAGYLEAALEGLPTGTQLATSNQRKPSLPCAGSPPYDDAPRSTGARYLARGMTGTTRDAFDGLVRYWVQDLGYTPVADTRSDEPGSTSDVFASVDTPDDYRLAASARSDIGLTVSVNSPCYAASEEGTGPLYPETIGPTS